ncbi:hypothetical protein H9Y04_17955 [Streptomyces sp. TRM66268-LWL]|uniref:Lipoprotein n=1 Tax=Streptomyces polyasparticus TaxID=2767826 RepID=A0ABR7SIP5_9ACTN|nr:hypothetical protein [Streptomyces polyasparticus]MBC9714447.1 hypothetical protein [Streptomyces polyasparticus]
MNRHRRWLMTSGMAAAAALLSACTGSGSDADPAPPPSPSTSAAEVSEKAATADKVKSAVESRISAGEKRFGSGDLSPCSTGSSAMFTQECADAAKATADGASFALGQIKGQDGFGSLRSVAEEIQEAAAAYEDLGCLENPADAATRKACLEPAAVLAQGFPDLRDGANLGLSGK